MPNQVHPSTKRNRYNKVMKLQQEISKKNLENKIETIQKVRIEGMTNNKKYYVGRSYMDVPEIDGLIYIENTKALNLGEWINCKIIGILLIMLSVIIKSRCKKKSKARVRYRHLK